VTHMHNVLNVVLTHSDANASRQVLLVVRRPETNARHPGMVSTLTMRLPPTIAGQLGPSVPVRSEYEIGAAGAGTRLVPFLVESLLARKLLAGDALEANAIQGTCALRWISEREVDDPLGTAVSEYTRMFTVVADLTSGWDIIPTSTMSYSHVRWTPVDDFRTAWRRRDGQMLFPSANPFEICIGGLCVQSAVRVLACDAADAGRQPAAQLSRNGSS